MTTTSAQWSPSCRSMRTNSSWRHSLAWTHRACSPAADRARWALARSLRSFSWIASSCALVASRAPSRSRWARRVSGRIWRSPPVLAIWRSRRPRSSQSRPASCSRRSRAAVSRAWRVEPSGGPAARTVSCSARHPRGRPRGPARSRSPSHRCVALDRRWSEPEADRHVGRSHQRLGGARPVRAPLRRQRRRRADPSRFVRFRDVR